MWDNFYPFLLKHITGIIHIGAHLCEEAPQYIDNFFLNQSDILWIEANPLLVQEQSNINSQTKIFNLVCGKKETKSSFYISNFSQCGGLYKLSKEHLDCFPNIKQVDQVEVQTTPLDNFIDDLTNHLDKDKKKEFKQKYNTLVISVNGAELDVLKGCEKQLEFVDYVFIRGYNYKLYDPTFTMSELEGWMGVNGFSKEKSVLINEVGIEQHLFVGLDIKEMIQKIEKDNIDTLKEEIEKHQTRVQVWED